MEALKVEADDDNTAFEARDEMQVTSRVTDVWENHDVSARRIDLEELFD